MLEFAEPLVSELPDGYSKSDLEAVLKLATCVWNACVVDQWCKSTQNVAEAKKLLSTAHPFQKIIVEDLIARKKSIFGNDPRAIYNECVITKNGQLVVRAEARLGLQDINISGSLH